MSDASASKQATPDREGRTSGARMLVAIAGTLLFAECGLVLLATRFRCPEWALAGHVFTVTALAMFVMRRRRTMADPRAHLLLCATAPFLGPVAAAGAILQTVCTRWFARRAMPVKEWYARLFPEPPVDAPRSQYARLHREVAEFRDPSGPAPFAEVMLAGSQEQKHALLTMACRDFRPVFAPVLQRALHDENSAIRVQAAATIARIEEQYRRRIEDLAGKVRARPEDAALRMELAAVYEEHSAIGWLDATRQEESRQKALALYVERLREAPQDEGARLAVGTLHLRAGRIRDASDWFETCMADGHASPRLQFGRLESLFLLGRYDQLHEALARNYDRLAASGELSPEALRTLEFWHAQALTGRREERRT